jgi:hypothetical protein
MKIVELLANNNFNIFFSLLVGVGIICIIRPICKGADCTINKPPADPKFDQYVYRMGTGKCYEFKTEIASCPSSGVVEAFTYMSPQFNKRSTIINV